LKPIDTKRWDIKKEDTLWEGSLPQGTIAVAFSFRGSRIGADWQGERIRKWIEESCVGDTEFSILRWLRIPVLGRDLLDVFSKQVLKYPLSFLKAWHYGEGLPEGLEFPEKEETVPLVIQTCLWNWRPKKEEVNKLVGNLPSATKNEGRKRKALMNEFSNIAPVLVDAIARNTENKSFCRETLNKILATTGDMKEEDFQKKLDDLLDEIIARSDIPKNEVKQCVQDLLNSIKLNQPLEIRCEDMLQRLCHLKGGCNYISGELILNNLR